MFPGNPEDTGDVMRGKCTFVVIISNAGNGLLKLGPRASEMVQGIKELVAHPDNLSLIPGKHTVGERIGSGKLSSESHPCVLVDVHFMPH